MPVVDTDPHLNIMSANPTGRHRALGSEHTFLNVLNPAKILPPIQVEYFLSGGAKILILISFTASL